MQTILGSGGAIGLHLAKALSEYTEEIRLVSRKPEKVNPGDLLMNADLLDPQQLDMAVEESSVVYITIGFPYSIKFWRDHWPPFIRNAIDSCIRHQSKMVFFDNIYMYDPQYLDGMTEETPIHPPSKKGEVRAEVSRRIMDAIESGKLTALIARAADFYGPGIRNTSVLTETAFKPLSREKKANWFGSVDYRHSFTYTPDAGKATALLGNTEDTYNQVWHLPTAPDPFTGKEWIGAIARELHVKPRYRVATKSMLKLMGLFSPVMREFPEMIYQYDRDYVFNSDKFNKRFNYTPVSYPDGIKAIVAADYS